MDEDDEFERLLAALERCAAENFARRFDAITQQFDEEPVRDLGPDDVVLLGFEGQIDAVMALPRKLDRVRLPLRQSTRSMLAMYSAGPAAMEPLPTAEYDRVGELTYQRIA